ncbi:MAG: hypothetical protein ACFB51_11550 [Anaerolineae bacterium]
MSEQDFSAHHGSPLRFGEFDHLLPQPPEVILAPFAEARARRPKNQGLSPVMHGSLEVLRAMQYVVPESISPAERLIRIGEAETAAVLDEEDDLPPVVSGVLSGVDPLYGMALYLAFALGTLFLPIESSLRLALLWSVLAIVGALYTLVDAEAPRAVSASDLAWGAGTGLIVGLPVLILAAGSLADTARQIFPAAEAGAVLAYLAFAAPIAETLFFRVAVQEVRGLLPAIVGAGANTAILFWPGLLVSSNLGFVVFVGVFFTALAGLYSIIRERYGGAAALVCQVTVNVLLLVLPLLIVSPAALGV